MSATATYAQVKQSTPQSIPANTPTALIFDTVVEDADGDFNGTTRLTAPTTGIYMCWGSLDFSKVADSTRRLAGFAISSTAALQWQDSRAGIVSGSVDTDITIDGPVFLNAGDSVGIVVEHDSPTAPRTVSGRLDFMGPINIDSIPVCWLARANSQQSIPAGTATAVTFDTEIEDDLGMWGGGSESGSEVVIPANLGDFGASACGYMCWGQAAFSHVQDSTRRILGFRVNGGSVQWQDSRAGINSPSVDTQLRASGVIKCEPGDHIELVVQHDSLSSPRPLDSAELFVFACTTTLIPWP